MCSSRTVTVRVESNYEQVGIMRNGDYSRSYTYKDTLQGCALQNVDVSFQPVGRSFTENSSLSVLECVPLAQAYLSESVRRDELSAQEKNYLSKLDEHTAKFGRVCYQAVQSLQKSYKKP